jgi:hypothetical protein
LGTAAENQSRPAGHGAKKPLLALAELLRREKIAVFARGFGQTEGSQEATHHQS